MNVKNNRVLIIDDERAICEVLSASLRDEGFVVETASNGEAGLAAIEKFNPAVVLLDIWMPGNLDGLAVLQKAQPAYPDIEFVMMSGHARLRRQ